jgi:hypothetical protein
MRWSELKRSSKGAGGKPKGWKPRKPARELTENQLVAALRAPSPKPIKPASDQIANEQRDYERIVKIAEAGPQRPENESPEPLNRWLSFFRARSCAVALVKFQKMDGWNGDKIEEFIN